MVGPDPLQRAVDRGRGCACATGPCRWDRRSSGRRPWWPAPARSRRAILSRLRPTTSSPRPSEYQSAMSKKLMPRSSARFRIGTAGVLVQHPALPGRASQAHGPEAQPGDLQPRGPEPHMIHRASSAGDAATMRRQDGSANRGGRLTAAWRLPEPVGVRSIENDWIETPDGVRLAVSLWLPDSAELAPVVLESIPYRKRDSTRGYASWWGRKLAERGVAYARLDCRGSGDSGGLLLDEYLPQEQADNVTAIAWLAAQALVQRRGRHARGLLGRVLDAAGRRAGAAGAEGDHADVRLGPPLHRRRPLRRRRLRADRPEVGDQLQGGDGRPARPGRVRTRLGSRVDGAAGGHARHRRPTGCVTSARTTTGARARSASTPPRSAARSTSSAAGSTLTTR